MYWDACASKLASGTKFALTSWVPRIALRTSYAPGACLLATPHTVRVDMCAYVAQLQSVGRLRRAVAFVGAALTLHGLGSAITQRPDHPGVPLVACVIAGYGIGAIGMYQERAWAQ